MLQFLKQAEEIDRHPTVKRFAALARELGVVLPVSVFERAGNAHFNTTVIVDADGRQLGIYRKSHIPDGPGYQEKFYFSPGDTGFKVWDTAVGTIGLGICWDQWFPEAARAMALMGAEILLYPTAIGSEPPNPDYDSSTHWQNVMRGHAAANIMPRAGLEPRRPGDGTRRPLRRLLWPLLHRRPPGREGRGDGPHGRGRAAGGLRPRRRSATPPRSGACSATGGRSSTARC